MTYTPGSYDTAPLPSAPKKRRGLVAALIAAALVLILAGAGVYWFVLRDTAPQQATAACEKSIANMLKAPATAKFSNERASSSPAGGYDVFGAVDAENSFSALVRNTWTCYAYTEGGTWKTRASIDPS